MDRWKHALKRWRLNWAMMHKKTFMNVYKYIAVGFKQDSKQVM